MVWKYGILGAITVIGAWAVFFFENDDSSDTVSGTELAVTALGFLLFTGGLLGLVVLIARTSFFRVTTDEMIWWEIKRTRGRTHFMRQFVTRTTLIGGTFISVLILYNSYGSESLVTSILGCLVIWITLTLASYAVADKLWTFYESEFKSKERG